MADSWIMLVNSDAPGWLFLPWEVSLNALGALLAVAPLAFAPWRWRVAALAVAAGVLIDLDHAVLGGGVSLGDMLAGGRSWAHSLLFAAVAALLVGLVTRRALYGWVLWAGLMSHLLRDGSGGHTPLAWPWSEPDGLPWLCYPLGLAALCAISLVLRRRFQRGEAGRP